MPPLAVLTVAFGTIRSWVGIAVPALFVTPQSVGTGIGTPSYRKAVAVEVLFPEVPVVVQLMV